MKEHGFANTIIFGGSFVTDKAKPSDIDLLLEITPSYGRALQADPTLVQVFDHAVTKPLGLHVKPWTETIRADHDLLVAFQIPSTEDVQVRGMAPTDRKGILRVLL